MKVIYSVRAAEDLRDIFTYGYRTFGLAQAERYDADLKRAAETAAQFSFLSQAYETASGITYRRYHYGRHIFFFTLEPDGGIFIGRILHDRMDFERHV